MNSAQVKIAYLLIFLAGLSACSTTKPAIQAVPGSPSLSEAQQSHITGTPVRWGGEVIKIDNFSEHTLVEIIVRDLDSRSRPKPSDHSEGRFLARIKQFIDPENLKAGRQITVSGTLTEWLEKPIGNYPYRYPLLDVEVFKIWPRPNVDADRPHAPFHWPYYSPYYWHDPFWGFPPYRGWPHPDYFDLRYNHW